MPRDVLALVDMYDVISVDWKNTFLAHAAQIQRDCGCCGISGRSLLSTLGPALPGTAFFLCVISVIWFLQICLLQSKYACLFSLLMFVIQ